MTYYPDSYGRLAIHEIADVTLYGRVNPSWPYCDGTIRPPRVVVQDGVVPDSESTPTYDAAFDELAGVLLEESYVLAIHEHDGTVEFSLDAVLTPSHPAYRPPAPDEQYYYRRGQLVIVGAERPRLRHSDARPATDATGEEDFGNIDSLYPVDSNGRDRWAMEGDWGELEVVEPLIRFVVLDT